MLKHRIQRLSPDDTQFAVRIPSPLPANVTRGVSQRSVFLREFWSQTDMSLKLRCDTDSVNLGKLVSFSEVSFLL